MTAPLSILIILGAGLVVTAAICALAARPGRAAPVRSPVSWRHDDGDSWT